MARLKQGDYVLATKWNDGDPHDHWYVGFLRDKTDHGRYNIVDNDGKLQRGNGFRKAQRITADVGKFILDHMDEIQYGNKSLWWWKRYAKEQVSTKSGSRARQ